MFISFGWCDSGADVPITEETRLEGALFPARDQRPGHAAVFCTISRAFDASPALVCAALLTNEEVLDSPSPLPALQQSCVGGYSRKVDGNFFVFALAGDQRGSARCGRLASVE